MRRGEGIHDDGANDVKQKLNNLLNPLSSPSPSVEVEAAEEAATPKDTQQRAGHQWEMSTSWGAQS